MAATKEDVVSFIDSMTVLEMSEFVKELEEKYGVTANDEIKVRNIVADEVEVDDDERSQDETADDMTD